jgi:hypothetical protein
LKRWRVGGRTVACSASIHAANLAKLLNAYRAAIRHGEEGGGGA